MTEDARWILKAWWALVVPVVLAPLSVQGEAAPLDVRAEFEQAISEFEQGQQLQAPDGNPARRLFRSAARRFERIIRSGVVNGRLEYNAGNAFLQADDLGRAILHYRRAERLMPRDALLADNLAAARKRCLINLPPTRRSVVLRNLFFWHYESSFRERASLALITYLLFWAVLGLRNFVARRSVSIAACVFGAVTSALACSLAVEHWHDQHAPCGIVTSMDVVVYKGPGTGYQRMFEQPLQPGVEFTLRERRAGWWNIELPDGRSGWIDEVAAALVALDKSVVVE